MGEHLGYSLWQPVNGEPAEF